VDSTNIKTPKLNVSTIKSPLSGGGSDLGGVGKGGTSKVGTLAKIVRKNRISINSLVKSQEVQDEKITRLKNISQIKQQNAGKKSTAGDINSSLVETNKILVDIQNQLALQSQNEQKEEKENRRRESAAESKRKLKKEESVLEKTAKGIGKAVGKVALKIVQPIGGIFDKILEFVTLLSAGIATNAAFEWFKDEENQKKITKIFNILKENWKLLANIFGTIIAVGAILKVAAAITTIGSVLALLGNPVVLKLLAVAGTAAGIVAIANKIKDITAGGEEYRKLYEDNNEKLNEAGVAQPSSPTSKETMLLAPNPEGGYFQMFRQGVDQRTGQFGNLTTGSINPDTGKLYATPAQLNAFDAWKSEKLKIDNLDKKSGELPEPRAMGGPVMAGNTYLVGERGPEIFSPNINGSIVNNMRTEKIVQTLSSDMGEGSINMIELPPITNQLPPPEIPVPSGPATEVPEVSSVNLADPYRQLTPMLYGITV